MPARASRFIAATRIPKSFYGNAVIGDAQNNLVHRMLLTPDGVTFRERRADPGTEFVRSSDNWFRPVNFVNAPDGTLYCLDMSREILESIHIPFDVLKFIDLKAGRDSGRLYRIAPDGFHFPGEPHLGSATHGRAGRSSSSIPTAGIATRPIGCSSSGRTSRPSRCWRRCLRKSAMPQARLVRSVVAGGSEGASNRPTCKWRSATRIRPCASTRCGCPNRT